MFSLQQLAGLRELVLVLEELLPLQSEALACLLCAANSSLRVSIPSFLLSFFCFSRVFGASSSCEFLDLAKHFRVGYCWQAFFPRIDIILSLEMLFRVISTQVLPLLFF